MNVDLNSTIGTCGSFGASMQVGDNHVRHPTQLFTNEEMDRRFGTAGFAGARFTPLPTEQSPAQMAAEFEKGAATGSPIVISVRLMQDDGTYSENRVRVVAGPFMALRVSAAGAASAAANQQHEASLYVSSQWLDIPGTHRIQGQRVGQAGDRQLQIVNEDGNIFVHENGRRLARLELVWGLVPYLVHYHRKLFTDAKEGCDNLQRENARLRSENEQLHRQLQDAPRPGSGNADMAAAQVRIAAGQRELEDARAEIEDLRQTLDNTLEQVASLGPGRGRQQQDKPPFQQHQAAAFQQPQQQVNYNPGLLFMQPQGAAAAQQFGGQHGAYLSTKSMQETLEALNGDKNAEARVKSSVPPTPIEISNALQGIVAPRCSPLEPCTWATIILAGWNVCKILDWLKDHVQLAGAGTDGRAVLALAQDDLLRDVIAAVLTIASNLPQEGVIMLLASEGPVILKVKQQLKHWRAFRSVVQADRREKVMASLASAVYKDDLTKAIHKELNSNKNDNGRGRGAGGDRGGRGGGRGRGGDNNNNNKKSDGPGNGRQQQT